MPNPLPTDPAFNQNPYPFYAQLHQGPSFFFWEHYGHYCAGAHEDVFALLRDKRLGREVTHVKSRAELGWPEIPEHVKPFYDFESCSLLEREPPVHTRLRGLINRAFVSRQIDKLAPRLTTLAHELIDALEVDRRTDLIPTFCTPIPMAIITEMLGVPYAMANQMLDWSHKMVAMYQFNRNRQTEDSAVKATLEFSHYIRLYIDQRRKQPGEDLISTLIAAEEGGEKLSTDELVATCILILNAGHEATVHALGNGAKALMEHKIDTHSAFATPETTASCVEECLRIDPPLHMFTRYCLTDFEYKGVWFKTGDKIGLMLGAANHDPKRFAEPGRFIPGRANAANHTSLGGGIHFCVGAPLARLEMQIALPILFDRLPGLKLAATPIYADRYHFHGLEALEVEW